MLDLFYSIISNIYVSVTVSAMVFALLTEIPISVKQVKMPD